MCKLISLTIISNLHSNSGQKRKAYYMPVDPRLVPSQLACSLGKNKGIETVASTGQPKMCIFGRYFLIGYSIFRREKPFADET